MWLNVKLIVDGSVTWGRQREPIGSSERLFSNHSVGSDRWWDVDVKNGVFLQVYVYPMCFVIVSDSPTTDENKESAQNREHESRTGDHGAKGQPWNARETAPQV